MSQHINSGEPVAFQFTGQGGEYFRIWIVNLALTLLTLGIYSAWAKVRRLQYFYRNTSLAGSGFDYHGDPIAILKGRILAILLLVLYNVAGNLDPYLGLGAVAVLLAVLPWLVQRSLRFKLHNSSYRGLRFSFAGTVGGAYKAFLLWPLAGYLSLGLLIPLAHRHIKAYQHGNSRYGAQPFAFFARTGSFFTIYLKLLGMLMLMIGALAALVAAVGALPDIDLRHADPKRQVQLATLLFLTILGFYLLAFLFIGPWLNARVQNLVWNGTGLGDHGFVSAVRARDLFVIYLTNFLAILLTLGLFKPYADIRLARYRLRHMALNVRGSLDDFVAGQQQGVSAAGEEAADVFDFDISF